MHHESFALWIQRWGRPFVVGFLVMLCVGAILLTELFGSATPALAVIDPCTMRPCEENIPVQKPWKPHRCVPQLPVECPK